MDTLFVAHSLEPKDIGLSQVVVEGSEAVRQRSKKVASSSRRPSPQRYLGGLSIRGGPGYGPNVCPEPVGYCRSTAAYSSFFFCLTW